MSPLSRAANAAAAAVLSRPILMRGSRVRAATPDDVAAIARCESTSALASMRAGVTEHARGTLGAAAVAVATVASVAAVVIAVTDGISDALAIAFGVVALVALGLITWLVPLSAQSRAEAWIYLLDRRIGELDGSAAGSHHNFAPTASFTGTFAPSLLRFGKTSPDEIPGEDQVTSGP